MDSPGELDRVLEDKDGKIMCVIISWVKNLFPMLGIFDIYDWDGIIVPLNPPQITDIMLSNDCYSLSISVVTRSGAIIRAGVLTPGAVVSTCDKAGTNKGPSTGTWGEREEKNEDFVEISYPLDSLLVFSPSKGTRVVLFHTLQ